MELTVRDTSNQDVGRIEVSEAVFGREMRADLLAEVVGYQLAKRRCGTASSKTRAEVRGGSKKPYRQKGTGNARQGTIRAPQFRTGGVVFGPKPHDFAIKLSKKVRKQGLQIALSSKYQDGDLILIDKFGLEEIKTKAMKGLLEGIGVVDKALIVLSGEDKNVTMSARNIPGITVMQVAGVNVYDILKHGKLVLTSDSLRSLEERLA
ncbi:MAG: 50S ribosomal protein L4 [Magnetococcus sp. DMHC-6]